MTGSRMRDARAVRRTVSWTNFDAFDTSEQLFYNPDLVKKFGITLPKSIDDLSCQLE